MDHRETLTQEFWRLRIETARKALSSNPVRDGCYDIRSRDRAVYLKRSLGFMQPYLYPGVRILDVGCGWGIMCEVLPSDIVYHGIDLMPEFIEEAVKSYASSNRTFEVVDLSNPGALAKWEGSSFDLAIGAWVEGTIGSALGHDVWSTLVGELVRIAGRAMFWSPGHLVPKIIERNANGLVTEVQSAVTGTWPPE